MASLKIQTNTTGEYVYHKVNDTVQLLSSSLLFFSVHSILMIPSVKGQILTIGPIGFSFFFLNLFFWKAIGFFSVYKSFIWVLFLFLQDNLYFLIEIFLNWVVTCSDFSSPIRGSVLVEFTREKYWIVTEILRGLMNFWGKLGLFHITWGEDI